MSSMLSKLKRGKTFSRFKPKATTTSSQSSVTECATPVDHAAAALPVRSIVPRHFFGHDALASDPLPSESRLTPEVYTTQLPLPLSAWETLSEPTYDVLTYLTWVIRAVPGEEKTLTDLLGSMVKGVGFVPDHFTIRVPKQFELRADSMVVGCAEADLAIQSVEGLVTLVAKVSMPGVAERELEVQLIKAAITCFHSNNTIRENLGLDKLEMMDVPALALIGTTLSFYFVSVDHTMGVPPTQAQSITKQGRVTVRKCQPIPLGCPGMEDVHSRRATFAYLTAFRGLAESACRRLRAGL